MRDEDEDEQLLGEAPRPAASATAAGHTLPTADEMVLHFDDPSLLRGASAHTLLKNRSEIFSSNELSPTDVAQLHRTTAVVNQLDDFVSHSWSTGRFDKWATLLLYLNAPAGAVAGVVSAATWATLEGFGIVPTLLLTIYTNGIQFSGMPMLVGYFFGVLFLFQWQRIRGCFGLRFRRCFLDKVCIDQVDQTRKTAGIASLGAFLGSSSNFVVLFSPEYFTRLWCCYELAAFHQVSDKQQQKVVFVPVQFPRLLFLNCLAISVACLPDAFLPLLAPAVGIDPHRVKGTETALMLMQIPGLLLQLLTMVACQRYVAARERIEEQMRDFSISRAQCFDERDRDRIEREVGKWFGGGDRAAGIRAFDAYVRKDIREAMEDVVGKKGSTLGAGIPWSYAFLSGSAAILEDISGLSRIPHVHGMTPGMRLYTFFSFSSCALVATPMIPIVLLWLSNKRLRCCGGWPAVLLGPVASWATWTLLIIGSIAPDNMAIACVQYPLVVLLGAWVFRESLVSSLGEALGCSRSSTSSTSSPGRRNKGENGSKKSSSGSINGDTAFI
eukprot:g454.t1